jgi:hypothetical protein
MEKYVKTTEETVFAIKKYATTNNSQEVKSP